MNDTDGYVWDHPITAVYCINDHPVEHWLPRAMLMSLPSTARPTSRPRSVGAAIGSMSFVLDGLVPMLVVKEAPPTDRQTPCSSSCSDTRCARVTTAEVEGRDPNQVVLVPTSGTPLLVATGATPRHWLPRRRRFCVRSG